ncbi:MAG: DNA-binding protein [Pseudanabaena sp.]|jgi:DNA-binding phage protein|uniref:helix-turn-helix domain-containing transcriptional regulator n=1 Tax=Pseudanabaena mucicola TaxID=71190 RepID=UPI000E91E754|nr:transcriptional regulator [Pseudanabaena mucicola]MCA6503095.1 transcriptional regulator [Pseudanabaena sp. M090S1SP2A07QC]MCA6573426.1 transcriptional regulator [Pseudanabaena sp. M53BS1SP1A06MG]MCA6581213.1 transcriptional regulator [Pseudanabaena sp. M34BS1SP1A06MG]MCA6593731.1 transcriptional regulator [Pseudanabaena sp. M38BS1SP1A06MG]MCA6595100.1 transcriptional regulator [Pseudanabaena sp. M046S1SP1A06QC]MCA6600353.1 transcriptional regulator [Pseudanabaena sp. M57BS1SP1A06MG]MCA66
MPTYKSYHSYLIESLKDPLEAAAYLDAVIEDGDFEHILLALKNVAEAQQDITNNSKNNKLNLDLNPQLLLNQQPSELMTIAKLLNQLGLKLSVTVQEKQPA